MSAPADHVGKIVDGRGRVVKNTLEFSVGCIGDSEAFLDVLLVEVVLGYGRAVGDFRIEFAG